jgi:hypothetical protein
MAGGKRSRIATTPIPALRRRRADMLQSLQQGIEVKVDAGVGTGSG